MTQNSWVWQQAQALNEHTRHKDVVIFECGFGPTNIPHMGTFAECIRTQMVRHAFEEITGKKTRLIVFSDDMDALRKIPDNVPNRDILNQHLGKSLSSIPNPFGTKYDSYSAHNNAILREFLDYHNFDYEFMSSTECYKSGIFNDALSLIAKHAEEIKEIVTKDYGIKGGNRKDTYCPFIYINSITNHQTFEIFDWRVCYFDTDEPTMLHFYTDPADGPLGNGRKAEMENLFDGNMKLQWKVDWAMRWIAFEIDFEMHGKDLHGSAQVGHSICKLLNKPSPITYEYELFLDEDGTKISKSKGNGLDFHDWMRYSTPEVVSYYMFQNPHKSRKLHFDVIPQMTDDYIKSLNQYNIAPDMDNPVWHIHNGDVPTSGSPVSFSMLLNLVSIADTQDPKMLLKFVQNYVPDATFEKYPMLSILIDKALNFYKTKVLPFKNYRAPTEEERVTLISLHGSLRLLHAQNSAMLEHIHVNSPNELCDEQTMLEENITSLVYEVGKQYYGDDKAKLRDFFQMIYEVILGQTSGPRLPVFIMMLGIDEFLRIIKEKIK